jgi:hypothetical protein
LLYWFAGTDTGMWVIAGSLIFFWEEGRLTPFQLGPYLFWYTFLSWALVFCYWHHPLFMLPLCFW